MPESGSQFACRSAFPARAVLHRTHVPDVQHVDGRVHRPHPREHRHRDAARRRAGRGVASQPRARLLRLPPLGARRARPAAPGACWSRCCWRDAPIRLAVDDTLFGRSGKHVYGAHYLHDGAQPEGSGRRTRWGNCWVQVVLVVALPCTGGRMIGLPLLFRLFEPKDDQHPDRPSQPELARKLIDMVIKRLHGRQIELVDGRRLRLQSLAGAARARQPDHQDAHKRRAARAPTSTPSTASTAARR